MCAFVERARRERERGREREREREGEGEGEGGRGGGREQGPRALGKGEGEREGEGEGAEGTRALGSARRTGSARLRQLRCGPFPQARPAAGFLPPAGPASLPSRSQLSARSHLPQARPAELFPRGAAHLYRRPRNPPPLPIGAIAHARRKGACGANAAAAAAAESQLA